MLIPAFFLNCVVAIGDVATALTPGAPPRVEWQTTGTGFFYGYVLKDDADVAKRQYEIYLVTARHVVAGKQNLKIRVNPASVGATGKEFEVPSNPPPGATTWFYHPDPTIDVAAVRVNFNELTASGFEVNFFTQDVATILKSQMRDKQVAAGDGVFVLGFPMNLAGQQRNYVIVRQGVIARNSEMLDNASTTFMVDAFVFPGNSGGPVVLKPEIVSIEGTSGHDRAALIGIVTQSRNYVDTAISPQTGRPRISFEENAGLAEVLPLDYVNEAITTYRRSKGWPDPLPRAAATSQPPAESDTPVAPVPAEQQRGLRPRGRKRLAAVKAVKKALISKKALVAKKALAAKRGRSAKRIVAKQALGAKPTSNVRRIHRVGEKPGNDDTDEKV
ncbi:serine protease [Bradyrhizobium barranii subsp. barranii]|uniref:Serine protease n=1 Tax=Bradyrhizobium barranii subsp. barranii TaxID=2823807 RepID=A0A7Z0TKH6_9BRAD|nr:serine protease [Bradyrhizobium barranii]UGX96442.1 serine protease [Bradyrhizobium barranii subsp. barranii]